MWKFKFCLAFFIHFAFFCAALNDDESDSYTIFHVYHSLEPSHSHPNYIIRGHITYYSSKNEAVYADEYPLSESLLAKLRDLVSLGDFYRIKISSASDQKNGVFSFTKACAIYESGLTDKLSVAVDQSGLTPISVGISAIPPYCTGENVPDFKLLSFNSTVNIVTLANAPAPDTLTYIQRLEQEKAEKARGDQGDNRSFFTKYWMYIIPVVILLFITGAANPEGQGGR